MKNRNRIAALQNHFIKVPVKLFNIGLDPVTICIYLALCSFTEEYNPSIGDIAARTGLHRNSVCRGLKTLCSCNCITKISQGFVMRIAGSQSASNGAKSLYEFNQPKVWTKFVKVSKSSTKKLDDTPNNFEE